MQATFAVSHAAPLPYKGFAQRGADPASEPADKSWRAFKLFYQKKIDITLRRVRQRQHCVDEGGGHLWHSRIDCVNEPVISLVIESNLRERRGFMFPPVLTLGGGVQVRLEPFTQDLAVGGEHGLKGPRSRNELFLQLP